MHSFLSQPQWSHQNETKNVVPQTLKKKTSWKCCLGESFLIYEVGCRHLFVPAHSSSDFNMKDGRCDEEKCQGFLVLKEFLFDIVVVMQKTHIQIPSPLCSELTWIKDFLFLGRGAENFTTPSEVVLFYVWVTQRVAGTHRCHSLPGEYS